MTEVKPKLPEVPKIPTGVTQPKADTVINQPSVYASANEGIVVEIDKNNNVKIVLQQTVAEYLGSYRRCSSITIDFQKNGFPTITPK